MTAQSPLIPSADLKVIRRNQKVTAFDASKISVAMTKAFLAVDGGHAAASAAVHDKVADLTAQVVAALGRRYSGTVHIEDIQDQVELALMRSGEHKVARSYVLYRDQQAQKRAEEAAALEAAAHAAAQQAVVVPTLHVTLDSGDKAPLNQDRMHRLVVEAARGLSGVSVEEIVQAAVRDLYDGIPEGEVSQALMMSARARIEKEPNYTYASARLLLDALRHEALKFLKLPETRPTQDEMAALYPSYLQAYVSKAVELELLAPELLGYDFARLGAALLPERDGRFDFLGLQTLYDRYFIHSNKVRFELPQAFFMRVAMGLALNEQGDKEARAIEFYQLLSSFDFMSSTPTLFNSGTLRPQLSSCYLTTVPDDLDGIFGAIKDNALLSKFAGGLGNDWTPVRGMSARIKGTNGKSQGVVPFLKVANDTCVAVNQCFAPETLLHTADGLKAIKDVQKGDLVLGISGQYRTVEHKFTYNQREPMRRLQIKHAISAIEVTSGHPFYALTGVPVGQSLERTRKQIASGKRKLAWVDAQDLHVGDYVAQVIPTEVVPVAGFTVEDARLYGRYLASVEISRAEMEQDMVRCGTTGQAISRGGLPFAYADLYNDQGQKRIARRFAHLPRPQTLALLGGLLETDGCLSRGKEISFTSTSQLLAEGLRYQCLRLGVPTSGTSNTQTYDVRIPATAELAALTHAQPLHKHNWLTVNGMVFSRVRQNQEMAVKPFVMDLIVEGDESYMTTSALAHNGGKRKGAMCAYLETWHRDIEEFLDLRKNTGDDRRRTHDMNTANWVPDLFMERVMEDGPWTLFSPDETPDLHDLYGAAFKKRYTEYEQLAEAGQLKNSKRIPALQLWRKMLSMLFETGHPWITFKDPCNLRSPQQHVGVVHSSNLCTEITLNTRANDEIAVCNLGSVNLPRHIENGVLNLAKLQKTITTAMRMLDNVIEYNYYSVDTARQSNLRHRPVGLGIMGFNDALYKLRLAYESEAAIQFADTSMEAVSYYAIQASAHLALERGAYPSFKGSLWSQGILPLDSIMSVKATRKAGYLQQDDSQSGQFDWEGLRNQIQSTGIRNSNTMAIAPTATIANITGVSQSIEPTYQNLYVKSNLSGDFTVVNEYLVNDLKALNLWDAVMAHDLKYYDGSVQKIERIPLEVREIYKCAFEIDAKRLIDAASRRQKWIDQAQSLNLYMAQPSGKKLDELYKHAWLSGLKTTYYLRSLGATHVEKTTISDTRLNQVGKAPVAPMMASAPSAAPSPVPPAPSLSAPILVSPNLSLSATAKACSILDPDCEACQ
jgi:ribonucleoside-diphosphate reductase alpha chain